MAEDWRIEWNEAEFGSIQEAEYTRRALSALGAQIGSVAKSAAPRSLHHHGPPGHGADTIHAETEIRDNAWTVRVSWDQLHAYMRFPERRDHFLVNAADRYATGA